MVIGVPGYRTGSFWSLEVGGHLGRMEVGGSLAASICHDGREGPPSSAAVCGTIGVLEDGFWVIGRLAD
jgi:hypothetical protein